VVEAFLDERRKILPQDGGVLASDKRISHGGAVFALRRIRSTT
jgi:hypothetical protein